MPIYEYVCPECDTTFEKMRPLSQSDEPCECPSCKAAARRKLSVFAAFSQSMGGVAKAVPGAGGGSSCSSCSGGSCSSCGS
jgi:putative FmdB family regulatory protein